MRRTVVLLASIAFAVPLTLGLALLEPGERAEAAYPGGNGNLVFHSVRIGIDDWYDIYTMNADGSYVTRLTDDPAQDMDATWSPDGKKIAFDRGLFGDQEIYTMNADGSGLRQLTSNSTVEDLQPTWSPDGKKIAFTQETNLADMGSTNGEIYVMNADGSNQTRLTRNSWADLWPSWSPDGKNIAFSSMGSDTGTDGFQIYIMNADGTNPTKLTSMVATPCTTGTDAPDWSPDGTKIAFKSQTECSNPDIFVMNADGSALTNLTNTDTEFEYGPAWSPDGKKIAYYARSSVGSFEIYTMNADGSGKANITNSPTVHDIEPNWQPLHAPYDFSGFFSPVDNPPTLNVTKAGNAIPVKFGLNGDQGLVIFAVGYPKTQQINCDSSTPVDSIEQTVAAGGSSLSHDATTNQYTYVWKTEKAWAGTCRQFTMKLDDGTVHQANFKFK